VSIAYARAFSSSKTTLFGWIALLAAGGATGLGAAFAPKLAVAGAAGLLFMAIAFRDLAAGMALFVALTFFDRTTALQSGGFTIVKLAGAVLLLLWAAETAFGRGRVPTLFRSQPRLATAALVLAAWTFGSALWAPDPGVALAGSEGSAFRLFQGITLLFIVCTAITERRHVWWVVRAFIAGSAFAAVIGFFGAYASTSSANDGRLSGGFDDPNELAAVLLVGIALCGGAFAATRRNERWIYAVVGVILFYGFVQTDSQAGIVALFAALTAACAFAGRMRIPVVAVTAVFLLSGVVYYTFYTAPVALETITSQDNVGNRRSLWAVADRTIRDHPINGVGAGNWVLAASSYSGTDLDLPRADLIGKPGQLVHNSYLQVTAELGLVGLTLFLAVIVGALLSIVRAVRIFRLLGEWELEMLGRALLIGLIGLLSAYTFATNQYEKQLWLLLGLGPALLLIARRLGALADPLEAP
jgi:O-antigen ligase